MDKLREREIYYEIFKTKVVEYSVSATRRFLTIDWDPILLIYFIGLWLNKIVFSNPDFHLCMKLIGFVVTGNESISYDNYLHVKIEKNKIQIPVAYKK